MTTFQYLIDAFAIGISWIWPTSPQLLSDLHQSVLGWGEISQSLLTLVSTVAVAYFVVHYRYDFLGLFSAIFKSILQPQSLSPQRRTLDQQIVIFLLIILASYFGISLPLSGHLAQFEFLGHPFIKALALALVAFGFHFSKNWNKRLKGLNHLRLGDAWVIAGLGLLAALPFVPWLGLLWIGFALLNYHFESILKYSFLLLTISLGVYAFGQVQNHGWLDSLRAVGYLNGVAALVVALTTIHLTFEHLNRNLNETTFQQARNFSIVTALAYAALYFVV